MKALIPILILLCMQDSAIGSESKSDKDCTKLAAKVGKDYDFNWNEMNMARPIRAVQGDAVEARLSFSDFKKLVQKKGLETKELDEREYNAAMLDHWCGTRADSSLYKTDRSGHASGVKPETNWSGSDPSK